MRTAMLAAASIALGVPAAAFEDGTVTLWTGANRDHAALREVADRFEADLGISVVIEEVDPDLPAKFQQAAAAGDGPDLVMWAHDRFGEWASGGLIAPANPSPSWAEGVLPTAMEAVTFDGSAWGWPVSAEAVHLIYNRAFVDEPPASFEEVREVEVPDGVAPIMWDYTNTYFTFPLMMAGGGFAFERVDGSYDGSRTGVNVEGAARGAAVLDGLVEDGIMPQGVDYGVMDAAMNRGEVAMVLNGPWAWNALRDAGIDFGVAPIPTVDGNPAPPFLGVLAIAVNAASPNKDLAAEFVENYLLTDEGLAVWNDGGALGALTDVSAAEAQDDPAVRGMLQIAEDAVPMPSNPEMGAFWSAMAPALTAIVNQQQEPQAALDDAARRILGE